MPHKKKIEFMEKAKLFKEKRFKRKNKILRKFVKNL